jgi:hypothetical protein
VAAIGAGFRSTYDEILAFLDSSIPAFCFPTPPDLPYKAIE